MTAATKVSACVDCATPMIGARPRCFACHNVHAASMGAQRVHVANRRTSGYWRELIDSLVFVILALVLLVRGCS